MLKLVKNKKTPLPETAPRADFDKFWSFYPRKRAKKDARKAFERIKWTPALWVRVMRALAAQRRSVSWVSDGGEFIPHASTWLNGERWDDEIDSEVSAPPCRWRGCQRPGLCRVGEVDYCEAHKIALMRGETP